MVRWPTSEHHEAILREQGLAEELARSVLVTLSERRECIGTPEKGVNSFIQEQSIKARERAIKQAQSLVALLESARDCIYLES